MLRSVLGAVILLLKSSAARAQATAELNGRVTDESGGVLPGVTMTVTPTDTGLVRSVVTGADGSYLFANLGSMGAHCFS